MSFSDWESIKINDVCRIRRGASPRPIQDYIRDKGIPWVKISDATVSNSRFINSTNEFIKEEGKEKSRFIKQGTLILSNSATPGIPKFMGIDACVHDGWLIVDEFKNITDEFLYYTFINERVKLLNLSNGSVFRNLKTDIVKNYGIKLPPMSEQKAIAHVLSTLDEKIEVNNQINKTLENMAQAIFKQWFVDFEFPNEDGEPYKSSGGEMVESELGMIPKGWVVKELGDVVEFQNGYAFKSKDLLDKEQGDCYHVFKMGHIIKGGGLNKEGTKSFVPKKDCLTLARYLIKKGDLLMCMTDMKSNVALLGHTALMDEDDKYILNQRVGLLRTIDPSIINYPYLYILSNSKDFIENLRSRANSGVQVNLSTKEIKETLIIVPSKHIHKKYNDITEKVFAKSFNIAKENEVLKNARDTLLPKLMSGEIRVTLDEEGEVS